MNANRRQWRIVTDLEMPTDLELLESYNCAINEIEQFVTRGVTPSGQMQAMLENNLRDSFGMADHMRRVLMFDILTHIYQEIPSGCWGSPGNVRAWLELSQDQREECLTKRVRTFRLPGVTIRGTKEN